MILAGTGHRPKFLPCEYNESHPWLLSVVKDLEEYLSANKYQIEAVISGVAIGWDTWLAETAIKLNIPVWAYIPFLGQGSKWPEEAQRRYDNILLNSTKNHLVCDKYTKDCFFKRDEAMVDDADKILALWNPNQKHGGTYHTVNYATEKGKEIINFWR